jgi:hypothetical protein
MPPYLLIDGTTRADAADLDRACARRAADLATIVGDHAEARLRPRGQG